MYHLAEVALDQLFAGKWKAYAYCGAVVSSNIYTRKCLEI